MCHKEMDEHSVCRKCDIVFWQMEDLLLETERRPLHEPWSQLRLPIDQSYYYFPKHAKFYTVKDMQRICNLKAFL